MAFIRNKKNNIENVLNVTLLMFVIKFKSKKLVTKVASFLCVNK